MKTMISVRDGGIGSESHRRHLPKVETTVTQLPYTGRYGSRE